MGQSKRKDLDSDPDSRWGTVRIERLAGRKGDRSSAGPRVGRSRYIWSPPPDIAQDLPAGFVLSFDCGSIRGFRHFTPTGSFESLVLCASLGGLALLVRENRLSRFERFIHDAQRLVLQKAPHIREHLDRRFDRLSDLCVAKAGRFDENDIDVLPDGFGQLAGGRGKLWSPRDVVKRGKAEAGADSDGDMALHIRLGLLAAARRNPLDPETLSPDQARTLVRLALFGLGPVPKSRADVVRSTVRDRLLTALARHLNDETETFNDWLKKHDNLVHAIAKKKSGGRPLDRELVRQVLLEIIFDSFGDVGDCISMQMTAFTQAFAEPLSDSEQARFDSLYRGQPYLGGIPLVLLRTRFAFLQEALTDLWEKPTDRLRIGVVLRLLQYYGEMCDKRRLADSSYKRRSKLRNKDGGLARQLPLSERQASASPAAAEFQEIAIRLAEDVGLACKCATTRSWHAKVGIQGSKSVTLDVGCKACRFQKEIRVSMSQVKKVAQQLRED
ncbi:MAG TPA: hypothetical protein VH120_20460 [Gemmataceae bacterium]|jgi:hypothetical protein|nr:hypothetical protein [Gemmataceae bacterium]